MNNKLALLDLLHIPGCIVQKLREGGSGEQITHQIRVPFPVSNAPLSFSSLSLLRYQDLDCQNVFSVDLVLQNDYEAEGEVRN